MERATRTTFKPGQQYRVLRLATLVRENTPTQSLKVRKSLAQHAGENGVLKSPRKQEGEILGAGARTVWGVTVNFMLYYICLGQGFHW